MNTPYAPDNDLEKRLFARLLDVFIRADLRQRLSQFNPEFHLRQEEIYTEGESRVA